MNKKIGYGVLVVFIVLLCFFVWWRFIKTSSLKQSAPLLAPSQMEKAVVAGDTAKTSASGAMDKANPFSANVNPVGGYKNPFE